jgi:hypothetical protein
MQIDLQLPAGVWSARLEIDPGADGAQHYHADVYRGIDWVCRIALCGSFTDRTAAEDALRKRLLEWVREYEARPQTAE